MDVRLPDGTVISGVPDNITKAELASKLQKGGYNVPSDWLPKAQQGILDKAIGAGEAALTAITGATGGLVGGVKGAIENLTDPNVPFYMAPGSDPKAVQAAMDAGGRNIQQGAASLTYAPRTESGQQQAQALGEIAQNLTPVLAALPGGQLPGVGLRGASTLTNLRGTAEAAARAIGGDAAAATTAGALDAAPAAVANAAQRATTAVTTLPRRAIDAITGGGQEAKPTPGTMGSAGAAATDKAAQRIATAESLGFTGDKALTVGQASRDAAQLQFETEKAKLPDQGAPLRERLINQNDHILSKFDDWIDKTGAEAPTLRAVGNSVDKALVQQSKADKAKVRTAYNAADSSPESAAIVDPAKVVSIGEGPTALSSTPFDFINSQPTGLPATALTDAARQYAVKLGIADLQDGQLVPRPNTTIKKMEEWRRAIGDATGYEAQDIRQSTILKALIDGQTEPVAGPMYRQARALRTRLAQNYEDRGVIAKLLAEKKGTTDRAVAFEDVFAHTMLRGSLDDVREARRVLQRSGEDGRQAWRDLQGQTLKWIKEQATKSVDTDSAGNRVVSPTGLNKAIENLDADGKLDAIFGKLGAQKLRDINEIAQFTRTVPPEAAINRSNTAATLLAAFGDIATSGFVGAPLPVVTAGRLMAQKIQDVKLRRRINDALNREDRKRQTATTF